MKILAIETSCDETAAAVLEVLRQTQDKRQEQFKVLSNVISSQIALHNQYGGVVPQLAAREHVKNISHVVETALKEASEIGNWKLEIGNLPVDLIAVTHGPGLGPALLVGLTYAKTLAWKHDKPIIGVNHMDGHIHSNWLEPAEPIEDIFPALNVIVSGGHTELVLMRDHGDYEIIGETLDDAVGEAFDKVARLMGLGYPGGPVISKLAENGNPNKYKLPRPMAKSGDFNFSYSGLKTAVLYLIRDLKEKGWGGRSEQSQSGVASEGSRSGNPTHGNSVGRAMSDSEIPSEVKADIAASFQEAAIDVLIQKAHTAAKKYDVKAILLSGGVSANKLLRARLSETAKTLGIKYFCPTMKYTTDNAAMIAAAGYFSYIKHPEKFKGWQTVTMQPNLSL